MSSLFNISGELRELYAEIEEMGGELTDEMAEQLAITEENFKDKVEGYANIIKSLQSDIVAIDTESKRLDALKKSKSKTIERLQDIVTGAISEFGNTTKTGGKYIDLGTMKLSVRNNTKCDVNDELVSQVGVELNKFINNLHENHLDGETEFKESFLKALDGGFDGTDLANLNYTIKFSGNLSELCDNHKSELVKLIHESEGVSVTASKSACKAAIENGADLIFATNIPSKSLIMK